MAEKVAIITDTNSGITNEFADKLKPLVNDFKIALREEIGVGENTDIDAVFIYHEN